MNTEEWCEYVHSFTWIHVYVLFTSKVQKLIQVSIPPVEGAQVSTEKHQTVSFAETGSLSSAWNKSRSSQTHYNESLNSQLGHGHSSKTQTTRVIPFSYLPGHANKQETQHKMLKTNSKSQPKAAETITKAKTSNGPFEPP